MPAEPKISLLVPCYNAARFLPRLAACVRRQTLPFAELVAYDDGSQDDSAEVARSLGFRVVAGRENRGVAFARNRLVESATQEWIHFHDADDLMDPEFCAELGSRLSDDVDLASSDTDWVDEASREVVLRWRYDAGQMRAAPCRHLLHNPMGLNDSIIRRSLWLEIGGCNEALRMWEDADVHVRLAHAGARCVHVPKVLSQGLRRGESFSHDYRRSWGYRLEALRTYARWPDAVDYRTDLAAESEIAARQLVRHSDPTGAGAALELCKSLGGHPPEGGGFALALLRTLVPPLTLIRWQEARRARRQGVAMVSAR